MQTRIVQIGNSRGIRISKQFLEQTGLDGEVEIRVEVNTLVIESLARPRAGWAEASKRIAQEGDNALLAETTTKTKFDEDDWEW